MVITINTEGMKQSEIEPKLVRLKDFSEQQRYGNCIEENFEDKKWKIQLDNDILLVSSFYKLLDELFPKRISPVTPAIIEISSTAPISADDTFDSITARVKKVFHGRVKYECDTIVTVVVDEAVTQTEELLQFLINSFPEASVSVYHLL